MGLEGDFLQMLDLLGIKSVAVHCNRSQKWAFGAANASAEDAVVLDGVKMKCQPSGEN